MKNRSKFSFFIAISVFIVCMCLSMISLADPPDPCTDPADYCPIDGGLSLLIAAGIGIGAKKAYNERKKKATINL